MNISRCLAIGLLLIPAIPALAQDAPAADAARDLAQFRKELGMSRVILMKEAAEEADLTDDQRQTLSELMKETEDKIVAAVDAERTTPSSADERKTIIKEIHEDFTRQVQAKIGSDPAIRTRLGAGMTSVSTLIRVISSGEAMEVMKEFELSEEQKPKAEELLDAAKKKIDEVGEADMPEEKKPRICVETIQKLRKLLTDEQREKWNTTIEGYARRNAPNGGGLILRAAPGTFVPAPAPAPKPNP